MSKINFPFNTPYNTAPFSKIKDSDFLPAIKNAIETGRSEIESIISCEEEPSFRNTIEALEFSGQELDRMSSLFFNLNAAETNETIQALAQEISPLLTDFANDILLNEKLYDRIKHVYEIRETLNLNGEELRLLEKKYKQFVRNGANLDMEGKKRLREIDKELGKLKLTFGEHVLAETNAFELHITDQEDLSGLPEGVLEAASQLAESKGKEGWIFTLNFPSYVPFMTYADNRELRKTMSLAYGRKGFQMNEFDNQEIVLKIVNLRHERAQLLGYGNHAEFVLEERMAKSPAAVLKFLDDLLEKARPAADKEFDKLKVFAYELDGITDFQKWDAAYYTEKLKQQLFDLDDEKINPYFKL